MLAYAVAWLPQEPPMFANRTIFENIAYGMEGVCVADVEAAARYALYLLY